MSGLFHSLLSKKHAEPECLTAQGIAARLERMFSEAASYIIIVSPYIKLNLRLRDILGEKKKAGVDITIIHKGPFTATDIATRHFQRSNLHAACFLTEKAALIGSMNLYDYSQVNNDELGIYMEKRTFPVLMQPSMPRPSACAGTSHRPRPPRKRALPAPAESRSHWSAASITARKR